MKSKLKKYLFLSSLFILVVILAIMGYLMWKEITSYETYNTLIAFIVFYFLNLIWCFFILLHQRNYDSKISWLFIIIIFPFIGQIFFVIFGRRTKANHNVNSLIKNQKTWNNDDFEGKNNIIAKDIFFNKVENIFKLKPKNFNASLVTNGISFFEKLFEELKKAKKFIHIEMYIIKKDVIWEKIKKILIQKAQENIKIRIIIDGFGGFNIRKKEINFLKSQGIEICIYERIFFPFIGSNSFYRNHKKSFIIDGKVVFTGGNNIGKEYVGINPYFGYWMDTNFIITGEIVRDYCLDFILDWYQWKEEILSKEEYAPIFKSDNLANYGILVSSGPNIDISLLESFFLQLIYQAKEEINIFTPYFVPTERVFLALKESLISGIKVNLFIPGKNDKPIVYYFNKFYCEQLEEYGANIWISNGFFLHSKAMIIDKTIGYIGTMNCDVRSFYSQYEINTFIQGELVNDFLKYKDEWRENNLIKKQTFLKKKSKNKFLTLIIKIFKPLF